MDAKNGTKAHDKLAAPSGKIADIEPEVAGVAGGDVGALIVLAAGAGAALWYTRREAAKNRRPAGAGGRRGCGAQPRPSRGPGLIAPPPKWQLSRTAPRSGCQSLRNSRAKRHPDRDRAAPSSPSSGAC